MPEEDLSKPAFPFSVSLRGVSHRNKAFSFMLTDVDLLETELARH